MKAISTKTIDFPSLGWAIEAGVPTDLPDDKDAQAAILAHPDIKKAAGKEQPKDAAK